MDIPAKGTVLREYTELTVHFVRMVRPLLRWMNRQPWVHAYAEWDAKHVPAWFTPMNVLYFGLALYALFVVALLITQP